MSALFSSSSNASDCDSDDSYCLKQKLYIKGQKKCRLKLRKIENKFDFFKNTCYKDQIKELEDKLLKVKLEMRHAVIVELRNFKLVNCKRKFSFKKQSIVDNYKNQAEILHNMMTAHHIEKINQLKAALIEMDIEANRWLDRHLLHSRGDRNWHPYGYIESDYMPEVKTHINYTLKEDEILEDWLAIKKFMSPSQQKKAAEKINKRKL